jgi:hypothetical protein
MPSAAAVPPRAAPHGADALGQRAASGRTMDQARPAARKVSGRTSSVPAWPRRHRHDVALRRAAGDRPEPEGGEVQRVGEALRRLQPRAGAERRARLAEVDHRGRGAPGLQIAVACAVGGGEEGAHGPARRQPVHRDARIARGDAPAGPPLAAVEAAHEGPPVIRQDEEEAAEALALRPAAMQLATRALRLDPAAVERVAAGDARPLLPQVEHGAAAAPCACPSCPTTPQRRPPEWPAPAAGRRGGHGPCPSPR